MLYTQKEKVLAYIVRQEGEAVKMLIFRHLAYPEAGVQVPAGTVEAGEEKLAALLREVKEESGLTTFEEIRLIGTTTFFAHSKQEIHQRYYYQLDFGGVSPVSFEHQVSGNGIDKNLFFVYEWVSIDKLPKLAADQDEMLVNIQS
ncbi:MAG: NUDIX domain-containing protein [Bacteroidota bacterium]